MTSLLTFLPKEFKIDFIRRRWIGFIISGIITVASLVSLGVQGLNFGIDFAGGILIEAQTPPDTRLGDLRKTLNGLDLGEVAVTTYGDNPRDVSIRIGIQEGGDKAQASTLSKVKAALGDGYVYHRVDVVGPKVGDELIEDGVLAVVGAILIICIYIWLRFEWQYSVGAMLALLHDVITTIGIFSIFHLEFDLTIVAALLTIAGYSINDTVVQYDRVRENLRRYKKMELPDLLNRSLNEVFTRTLLTSITTLLAVLALLVLGGDVLRGFSLAVTWGVIAGTYSSFYMALPLLMYLKLRRHDDDAADKAAAEAKP